MKKMRFISSILICSIIAAVAACNHERDKRYFCRDEGFSICFPKKWKVTEKLKGTRILAEISDEEGLTIIKQNVNVVAEKIHVQVSLKEYMELQINGLQKLKGMKILESGETSLDRAPARWFTYSYTINDFGYQALVYALNKNNTFYVITGISQFDNFHKYKNRFHEIAKSFRLE